MLPFSNAWTYGVIAISLAGVLGPRFFAPSMTRATKITIAGLWVVGAVAIGGLFLARPNLAPFAEWLRAALVRSAAS